MIIGDLIINYYVYTGKVMLSLLLFFNACTGMSFVENIIKRFKTSQINSRYKPIATIFFNCLLSPSEFEGDRKIINTVSNFVSVT